MKQRATKTRKQTKRPQQAQASVVDPALARRDILKKFRNVGIGLAVAVPGAWFVVKDVQATIREHDLAQIGNGVATIVQIHDPQCPVCQALQRETRAAICEIASDDLQFLVADIRTEEGSKLARAHNVPHVTLLLLDGNGKRREILRGPNERDYLELVFRRHLERYGGG